MHRNAPISPFRYPGGKGSLAPFLSAMIATTPARTYVEPFAGGAAAGWKLLRWGAVDRIVLNDLDLRIYAAWRSMIYETDRFVDRLLAADITIAEWQRYAEVVKASQHEDLFELGFATFFLNRTNRSGIILGAAPIGGYQQLGTWKIDARMSKDALSERIRWIGSQREKVELSQLDASAAIEQSVSRFGAANAFFFIDPPYVGAGSRLYLNSMEARHHAKLSRSIRRAKLKYWVLTYDRSPLVEQLYADRIIVQQDIDYSLARRRKETELAIYSRWFFNHLKKSLAGFGNQMPHSASDGN